MMRILVFCALMVPSVLMAQTKTKVVTKTPVSKTKTVTKGMTSVADRGKNLYQLYCLACHQADGGGVGTLNPPLVKEWVTGDKSKLVRLLLKGSVGKVTIDGDTFSNTMPPQLTFTDQQIADVLTYIRSNFGFKASAVTTAEVKSARAKTK
jgi:mono/diheme cytochrome c family protein